MKLHDISMPLNAQTAEWPGDTAFQFRLNWTKEASGSVNVGEMKTSTHIGTHIDAPFHFDDNGETVDQLPIENYVTKAIVVNVVGKSEISKADLPKDVPAEVGAVLLKTTFWTERSQFPSTIPLFHSDIVEWMTEHDITLFGVDLPSVDPIDSKELLMHHALHHAKRYILEGIVLDSIKEDTYELIALPLKIEGADGSPVRAVLKEI